LSHIYGILIGPIVGVAKHVVAEVIYSTGLETDVGSDKPVVTIYGTCVVTGTTSAGTILPAT
jgi:hypothetical protein